MSRRFVGIAVLTTVVFAAVPAYAQIGTPRPRGERPTRGMFASGTGGEVSKQFVLNFSFTEGYDDDLLLSDSSIGQPAPGAPAQSGRFTGGSGSMNYTVNTERLNLEIVGAANGRYYPTLDVKYSYSYSGQAVLGYALSERTSISSGVVVGQQPNNIWFLYGTRSPDTPPDEAPIDLILSPGAPNFTSLNSNVSLEHRLVGQLSLTAGYTFFMTNSAVTDATANYKAQNASAGVRYEIARGLAARAGMGFALSTSDGIDTSTFHGRTIDAGIDFNRALSVSRRSTLSFGSGVAGLTDSENQTSYYLTGFVVYGYEIGRSWTFAAAYNRSASLFSYLATPVQLDTGELRLGGQMGRRLAVSVSVQAGRGTAQAILGAPSYIAASGTAGMRWAISRHMGLSAHYGYYRYEFDEAFELDPQYASREQRQSIRVSFDIFAPLVTRDRRANASR